MDGDGVQQAFCPLLWKSNGGKFNSRGRPIIGRGEMVRGACTRAYDCDTCSLMQEELAKLPVNDSWWICPDCTSRVKSRSRGRGAHLTLPGFYTEGYCQNPNCQREGDEKYTGFLQLVLGDIRLESG